MYFSLENLVIKTECQYFSIEKINGELHRLYAKEQFRGFKPQKSIQILLTTNARQLENALVQPNFYVMAEGLKATAIISSLSK